MGRNCRFCNAPLSITFVNLGMSPISNNYISVDSQDSMEPYYPLHAFVCEQCFLVQLIDFERADNLFSDAYAYFSSYSESWLRHAEAYVTKMSEKENLDANSLVIEIASNDGYLLQYFKKLGVPVLGIEPTANTARVAVEERGVPTDVAFFGRSTAARILAERGHADLIAANNVLAHVPDINDFVGGYPILLKKGGLATVEFPHLLSQIENRQFDTVYHEHFSYLSFTTARAIFSAHGMRVYDKAELTTHGGSLRLYVCHADDHARIDTPAVSEMLERECRAGLGDIGTYKKFSQAVIAAKCDIMEFLITAKRQEKLVVGYGAPAKGNTLLNYCGIGPDLLRFTVDRSPYKQGKLLPGVRVPVLEPDAIFAARPDFIFILPWNLTGEIVEQMQSVRNWGCKFVVPIPTLKVLELSQFEGSHYVF